MNIFSGKIDSVHSGVTWNIIHQLPNGKNIVSFRELEGGANSRVYLLTYSNGKKYVGKSYYPRLKDLPDGIAAEFTSLSFLWNHGVRCIPKPLHVNQKNHCALYEYVDGSTVNQHHVIQEDINQVCGFLAKLSELKNRRVAKTIPLAKEACFSTGEIIKQITVRLKRLLAVSQNSNITISLNKFLRETYIPLLNQVIAETKLKIKKNGSDFTEQLPFKYRTLSPSDFGFHNAVRRKGGTLVFLDFEYFGWDDPAKMISDFLLHPKTTVKKNLKKIFVRTMLKVFHRDEKLQGRLKAVFPLYGLKWCLILLNEFIPADFERRQYAKGGRLNKTIVCKRQLTKAKKLLSFIQIHKDKFPYGV